MLKKFIKICTGAINLGNQTVWAEGTPRQGICFSGKGPGVALQSNNNNNNNNNNNK